MACGDVRTILWWLCPRRSFQIISKRFRTLLQPRTGVAANSSTGRTSTLTNLNQLVLPKRDVPVPQPFPVHAKKENTQVDVASPKTSVSSPKLDASDSKPAATTAIVPTSTATATVQKEQLASQDTTDVARVPTAPKDSTVEAKPTVVLEKDGTAPNLSKKTTLSDKLSDDKQKRAPAPTDAAVSEADLPPTKRQKLQKTVHS